MTSEEKEKAKREYMAAVEAERAKLKKAVEAVVATDNGKDLIKFLHRICGYDQDNLVLNRQTGEVDTVATTIHEGRRGVYLRVRALVPIEVLRQIEYNTTSNGNSNNNNIEETK
jgi:hypothetical protein